ncbi:MAG: alpha/beta fold hydrolase, partial [Myxococcales bacterium]|nr:alpha/beta fold hydrolase [Myxococcales bacterium]
MKIRTLGYETHVEVAGEGPPVLLIHGWCDSHRTWRDVAPALAARHRVITPDLKGHGWSDKPDDPYHPDEFVAQMEALVEALDLRDLVLGGNSLGG